MLRLLGRLAAALFDQRHHLRLKLAGRVEQLAEHFGRDAHQFDPSRFAARVVRRMIVGDAGGVAGDIFDDAHLAETIAPRKVSQNLRRPAKSPTLGQVFGEDRFEHQPPGDPYLNAGPILFDSLDALGKRLDNASHVFGRQRRGHFLGGQPLAILHHLVKAGDDLPPGSRIRLVAVGHLRRGVAGVFRQGLPDFLLGRGDRASGFLTGFQQSGR